jgi:hypothetical protein
LGEITEASGLDPTLRLGTLPYSLRSASTGARRAEIVSADRGEARVLEKRLEVAVDDVLGVERCPCVWRKPAGCVRTSVTFLRHGVSSL